MLGRVLEQVRCGKRKETIGQIVSLSNKDPEELYK